MWRTERDMFLCGEKRRRGEGDVGVMNFQSPRKKGESVTRICIRTSGNQHQTTSATTIDK